MTIPADETRIEALFGEWLAQRTSGSNPDLESVCRAHPAHAERLREMKRAYELLLECAQANPGDASDVSSGTFGERLERTFGKDLDPAISLDPPPPEGPARALVRELG